MPNWPYLPDFHRKDQKYKRKQKVNYDSRHRVNSLPHLSDDSPVYIRTKDKQVTGTIVISTPEPHSYTVEALSGTVCQNRYHLVPVPSDTALSTTTAGCDHACC